MGKHHGRPIRHHHHRRRPGRLRRRRSAPRSSASRPRSSSASISAASASTGAASRPRRCCARPRSTTTCSTPRITASRPKASASTPPPSCKRSRGGLRPAQRRRRHAAEEEQGRRDLGRGDDRRSPARSSVDSADEARHAAAAPAPKGALGAGTYQAKHIIVATGARPRVLPGIEPDGKLIWTYFEAMVPPRDAEIAARHGLGRHRHRVRLLLPHHGRRGDGGRGAAADPARRGCGDRGPRPQALREAGHQDPDRRQGDEGREGRGLRHRDDRRRQGRRRRSPPSG